MQQKIIPNLWFDTEAEEAAGFYTSVFENSRILNVSPTTPRAGRGRPAR
jgi:predicted 3-demethylubiquinone-9 3-methyltransferase (glyoxalase superfamily)